MDIQHDSWKKVLVNSLIKVSKNGSPLPQFLKRHYDTIFKTEEKLNELFKEQLPSGKLEIVFRTTQRISSCFRFKDAITHSLMNTSALDAMLGI